MELIVAVYDDWGIGADGDQPIALSADRKFFRETTRGATVIAGRKTVADFPGQKPLPGRDNYVLSRQNLTLPGFGICHDLDSVRKVAENAERAFIIGGGMVYRQFLPLVDKLYITHIHHSWEDADTFFPEIDPAIWQCVSEEHHEADEKNPYPYTFAVYTKK